MDAIENKVAQNFARLRAETGFSVAAVAQRLRVHRQVAMNLEKDVSSVKFRTFVKAAEFYGCPWGHLADEDSPHSEPVEWLVHQIRNRLSVYEQDLLIAMVEKFHKDRCPERYERTLPDCGSGLAAD